ncbi:glycosyltransferase family 4 protein [Methylococcus capsulatus]|uniref:glycosyltransferase family 4 protein n=1 Tax=Methylococcus capsulatus TaxID=414 RepID=UPI002FDA68A7
MKVAVLFDNLGPYHIARLGAAAQRCDLLAIEVASVSADYAWTPTSLVPFRRKTLFPERDGGATNLRQFLLRLEEAVSDHGSEVLALPGWSRWYVAAGLLFALNRRIPVIVMSESQEIDFPRSAFKEWLKRRYVGLCDAALVGGRPHADYLAKLGMERERIFPGYDVVDNAHFARAAEAARNNASAMRQTHDLPQRYFLASARFVAKKNLDRLIRAYARYRHAAEVDKAGRRDAWHLVILGDGALRPRLQAIIAEEAIGQAVHLPGFKQIQELPVFYALGSAFIHASTTEQWGLVVNEAMATGLPVIVSKRCGCAPDLVEEGRNGYTFDPYDVDALSRLMLKVASDDCDRAAMGRASQEIIARWSPETFAENLSKAVDAALNPPGLKASLLDTALLWALRR